MFNRQAGKKMKLTEIYDQIPQSTCPPGCGRCCGILFLSMAELRNVLDWCRLHHVQFKDFTMLVGDNCPYLDTNKSCTIYTVRPFLCRILGVSSDLPCPLNLCKPTKLLNHTQSSILYRDIYLRGKEKPRTEKYRKLIREALGYDQN